MKKVLSLLSALTIMGTSMPNIIAASSYKWSVPVDKEKYYAKYVVNDPIAEYTLNLASCGCGATNWNEFVAKYPTFSFDAGNYIQTKLKDWMSDTKALDGQVYQTSDLKNFVGKQLKSKSSTKDYEINMNLTLEIVFFDENNQISFSVYGSAGYGGAGSYLPGYKVLITNINFNLG